MSLPQQGKVLGIDVGYAEAKRTTGFCVLSWDAREVGWSFQKTMKSTEMRMKAIRQLLGDRLEVLAVAVDGPLRPHLQVDTHSYRAAESLLCRGRFQTRGKPGPTNAGSGPELHREATKLAQLALKQLSVAKAEHVPPIHEQAIAEAFPNLFLGILCDEARYPTRPKKKRKWTDDLYPLVRKKLEDLLTSLLPCRDIVGTWNINDHEEIASLVCALTALCVANQHFVAVGSATDGYIVLPPSTWWGSRTEDAESWARAELRNNLKSVGREFCRPTVLEDGQEWPEQDSG